MNINGKPSKKVATSGMKGKKKGESKAGSEEDRIKTKTEYRQQYGNSLESEDSETDSEDGGRNYYSELIEKAKMEALTELSDEGNDCTENGFLIPLLHSVFVSHLLASYHRYCY